jgi:hypothetical protein
MRVAGVMSSAGLCPARASAINRSDPFSAQHPGFACVGRKGLRAIRDRAIDFPPDPIAMESELSADAPSQV